jgi:hypothetical protein
LFAHVGGIAPVLANVVASPLVNLDLGSEPGVVHGVPGRVAPYDDYTSTAALWALRPTDVTPPSPVFSYSAAPPAGGSPATGLHIAFSSEASVSWAYDAAQDDWLRSYGTAPDLASDGSQQSATNVVVQVVHVTYGPWAENSSGSLEVQANLYQAASGPALVLRNGQEIVGTWHRSSLGSPTQFVSGDGATIPLAPGRTWVELVPSTVNVAVSPSGAPGSTPPP